MHTYRELKRQKGEREWRLYTHIVNCLSKVCLIHVCTMVYLFPPSAATKKNKMNSANHQNELQRLVYIFMGPNKKKIE